MEDKIVLILDALRNSAGVEFSGLMKGFQEKMHGVMTFLAGLELTRRRMLFLRQTSPFAELWIYRREDGPDDELEDELEDHDARVVNAEATEPETLNHEDEGAPPA